MAKDGLSQGIRPVSLTFAKPGEAELDLSNFARHSTFLDDHFDEPLALLPPNPSAKT